MKASDIAVNLNALESGRWITDIPGFGDLRVKTRGFGNVDWRRVSNRELQKVSAVERRAGLSVESEDRILVTCLLEAGLLDWDNLLDDDGTPIPVSMAKELLMDPKYRNLVAACAYAAREVADIPANEP